MKFLLFTLCLVAVAKRIESVGTIQATGNGILPVGSDLTLKYETGREDWMVCYWYRYEHDADYDYCMFLADSDGAKKGKCKPANTTDLMEYSGTKKTECTVVVKNVNDEDDCAWAARVDDQRQNAVVNITVAKPISKVTVSSGDLVAGTPALVQCEVEGGRPAPMVNCGFSKTLEANSTMLQTSDEKGIYSSTVNVTFVPRIEDHGVELEASAYIMDGNNKTLFEGVVNAQNMALNVTFPPQPADNQSFSGKVGENVTASFTFTANPVPTNVLWTVVYRPRNDSKKHESRMAEMNKVELKAGFVDEKYVVGELKVDNLTFTAVLTILKLEMVDHERTYELVITNSAGSQSYFFEVDVEDAGSSGNPAQKQVNNGAVIAISVLVIVTALIVGSVLIYRKYYMRGNETSPLSPS